MTILILGLSKVENHGELPTDSLFGCQIVGVCLTVDEDTCTYIIVLTDIENARTKKTAHKFPVDSVALCLVHPFDIVVFIMGS